MQNNCAPFQRESTLFCHIVVLVQGGLQNTEIAFSPSVPFTFFLLGAFVALRIFGFCNTSRARMFFLRMPDADVLLALRFFTSSMHSELIENVSSNSNGKPRAIFILFSRTRFYNAMSLPPKPEQRFFSFATIVLARK